MNDKIIAINNHEVTAKSFDPRIQNFKNRDKITLTYFRRDKLTNTDLTLDSKYKEKPKIVAVKNPTKSQQQYFEAWSGISWKELQK